MPRHSVHNVYRSPRAQSLCRDFSVTQRPHRPPAAFFPAPFPFFPPALPGSPSGRGTDWRPPSGASEEAEEKKKKKKSGGPRGGAAVGVSRPRPQGRGPRVRAGGERPPHSLPPSSPPHSPPPACLPACRAQARRRWFLSRVVVFFFFFFSFRYSPPSTFLARGCSGCSSSPPPTSLTRPSLPPDGRRP